VTMAENHLDDLENNTEFIKFALLNPNININTNRSVIQSPEYNKHNQKNNSNN
jgi:hypothetical protein